MSDREDLHDVLDVIAATERDRRSVHGWVHKGTYDPDGHFTRGDIVRLRGSTYVAVSDTPGPCPADGWQLLAEVGAKGDLGDRGPAGAQGKAGQTGPPGSMGPPGVSITWRGRYKPFTDYGPHDVVYYDYALWICLSETRAGPKADQVNWDLMMRTQSVDLAKVLDRLDHLELAPPAHAGSHDKPDGSDIIPSMMYMVAPYAPNQAVKQGAVVSDEGWLMHANQDTDERAAPQPIGERFYLYAGADPTTQLLAKQVVSGTRYTVGKAGFIDGYRVYTITGNRYTVFVVDDPEGEAIVTQLLDFEADVTGWTEFGSSRRALRVGQVFDVRALVAEPAAAPTTWTGNWNYTTPNNPAVPEAGVINHDNKNTGWMDVSYIDNDGGDRSTELLALTPGDVINALGASWAIQTIQDFPLDSYVKFAIAPAVQAAPDGVTEFTFETITATPITFLEDIDWWTNNPATPPTLIQGVYAEDGAVPVTNGNAYGVDVRVQHATASEHWDYMAYSD